MTVAPPMGSIQARRNPFAGMSIPLIACFDVSNASHYALATSKIDTLYDFSGNGRNSQQTTDARRWTYHAVGTAFACPTMKAAGSQIMQIAGMGAYAAGITIAARFSYAAQGTVAFETGSASDTCGLYLDATPRVRALRQKASSFTEHAASGAGLKSIIATIDPSVAGASQVRTYDNNVVGSSLTTNAAAGTIAAGTWSIGARDVGSGAPGFGCTMELAAIAFYAGIATSNDRALINAALNGYA